jgi:2-dehydro-3-deoxygalactonokinase
VQIRGGSVTGFSTFMTGEVFAVLRRNSILQHSTCGIDPVAEMEGPGREAFDQGLRRSLEGDLLAALFRVRTRQLLDGTTEESNAWYLSGLLIGTELTGLDRKGAGPVIIAGGDRFGSLYRRALEIVRPHREHRLVGGDPWDHAAVRGHARLLEAFRSAKEKRR